MVEAISPFPSIGIPTLMISSLPRVGSGKVTMPVRPAYTYLATFKHIQVVPDRNGIPLYKLNALDALIERLTRAGSPSVEKLRRLDSSTIDDAVKGLSLELASRAAGRFTGGNQIETGLVVDLAA